MKIIFPMFLSVTILCVTAVPGLAHPGGLDSKGGHTNRKTGAYHYHRKRPDQAPATTNAQPLAIGSFQTAPATMAEVKTRLAACRALQDSLARLACFEKLSDSLAIQ